LRIEGCHLIQAIRDAGPNAVHEQPDFVGNNVTDDCIKRQHRSLSAAERQSLGVGAPRDC